MKKHILLVCLGLALPLLAMAAPAEIIDYYAGAMSKMHDAMMQVHPIGDADADFVQNMIPHHQAAIDMAQIELKNGKDPEIRKLAQNIIAAQQSEIKTMNAWLAAHQAQK